LTQTRALIFAKEFQC